MSEKTCPRCGAKLKFRLGTYECSSCDFVEQSPSAISGPSLELSPRQPGTQQITLPSPTRQSLPMLVERWLLYVAGLAVYLAGSVVAWLLLPLPEKLGEQGAIVLFLLWPWVITWILGWLLGHIGVVLSVLLVAALQALVLFNNSIPARYAAIVFLAGLALWFTFITTAFYSVYHAILILLAPAAVGIWGIVFLIRDIRSLRIPRDVSGLFGGGQ